MATYVPPKRATELIFYFPLVSRSTGQFQVNPTLAAGDVKITKDGGALANLATLPVVTPAGSIWVKVTVAVAEMTSDNAMLQFIDVAGAEWNDVAIPLQTSANQIDDLSTAAALALMQADVNTVVSINTSMTARIPAALVGGRMDASIGAMAANVLTAAAMAADASAEIAATWLATVVEGAHTLGDYMRLFAGVLTGKSSGGGTTTVAFRDVADTKNRISATVDASGNRTAVGTRDGT